MTKTARCPETNPDQFGGTKHYYRDVLNPNTHFTDNAQEAIMTKSAKLSAADLQQFSRGTQHYYRHVLNPRVHYTDGAKYVAEQGGAYWLLDMIAGAQRYDKRVARQPFQVWKLSVKPDGSAIIRVEDGNYNLLLTHSLAFTDFPMEEFVIWFSKNVIYLPVEH